MDSERMRDMVERYGETCDQKQAARLMNVDPRTISRMISEGYLHSICHKVDVRSIALYIEEPDKPRYKSNTNGNARKRKTSPNISREQYFKTLRHNHWGAKK